MPVVIVDLVSKTFKTYKFYRTFPRHEVWNVLEPDVRLSRSDVSNLFAYRAYLILARFPKDIFATINRMHYYKISFNFQGLIPCSAQFRYGRQVQIVACDQ